MTDIIPPLCWCYPWMFRGDGSDPSTVEALIALREGINDLPETAATFRLNDVTDRHHSQYKDVRLIYLTGAWEAPEEYNSKSVSRYVNPNYIHREAHSDLYVECGCGAQVGPRVDMVSVLNKGKNHSADCVRSAREAAVAELHDRREEWLRTAAYLWLTQEEASRRMGLPRKGASRVVSKYDIDWTKRRRHGRLRQVNTWIRLHEKFGYTYKKIGKAFDVSPNTISAYVSRYKRGYDLDP